MKKLLVMIGFLAFIVPAFAQQRPNYGIRQFTVNGFKSDSTKYTSAFTAGDSAYVSVVVTFNDTSIAGYGSDSVAFYYFYQRGYPCFNGNGLLDTFWHPMPLVVDTVKALIAADWRVGQFIALGADGTYADSSCVLDSASVSGMGATARQFAPIWSPLARLGFKGITGNSTTKDLKLRALVIQGVGVMTQVVK